MLISQSQMHPLLVNQKFSKIHIILKKTKHCTLSMPLSTTETIQLGRVLGGVAPVLAWLLQIYK